jgi:DNA repair exonuclease SbcCD ATPase subunit
MLKNKELSEYLKENQKQKDELEDEMLECGDRLGEIELQRDRLAVEQETLKEMEDEGEEVDEARLLELEGEIEDLEMEQNSIVDTLDNLQEHMDFLLNKINEITTEIISYDMNNINPPRFKGLKNVDVARATLQTFFLVMLDLNVYKKELETKCIDQDEKIMLMQNTINVMKHENPDAMSYAEK